MKPTSMITRAKELVARPLGLHVPGRALRVYDDDVFLVSYPRSGNTWARFLLGDLASRAGQVDFVNIERVVPDIYQNRELRLRAMPRPRLLKSHEPFDPRYRHVIYLVRDPRDVVVSFYNYQVMMNQNVNFDSLTEYADHFLRGEVPFGSWREHVDGWLDARAGSATFLLIRYEDLSAETVAELTRVARFLEIQCDTAKLSRLVQRYTADRMRELESRQWKRWKPMKLRRSDRGFVRSGAPGGWRRDLPPALARRIEGRWRGTMERVGYS